MLLFKYSEWWTGVGVGQRRFLGVLELGRTIDLTYF